MENTQKPIPLTSEEEEFVLLVSPASRMGQQRAHSELESIVIRLFDQFQGRVLRYVMACGLPLHDAEDVVQETFLSLFRHLELGRPSSNLNGWLFRVAHNMALKRRAAIQAMDRKRVDQESLSEHPCGAANAEEKFSFNQTKQRLRAVVEALPEQDQRCLYLRAEGLKYRQIADVLGISLGSVSLSLSRSFARIIRATERGSHEG
ncbi:RNA polymerase sigma-70 factor, ECF subfamily [Acidisarcina polymorpha]|uniref:RNA polymerase sigma-70 factor, ECF subfamily n=2 Tax=Acidisarcina polymorpha TaxID=2211140 RepID=A0A2Z5G2P7_9BACT|nr:RNA polymerase sigma-70 factor, ECF subfamily [Acidisarcina polymorpha]